MNSPAQPTAPTTRLWQDTLPRRIVTRAAFPVFYLLNRPALQWFGKVAYDFALRCNGIAINFHGSQGLTIGEERFITRSLAPGEGGVLLDVGANNGVYSRYLLARCPAARIYAFEPHPRTFGLLQERMGGNAGLTLVNKAVSDAPGAIKLYDFAADDGSTQASLDEGAIRMFAAETVAHDVTATTIDAFMQDEGIARIRLLKIDTEGFDLAVLQGASRALAAKAIELIQFEFIPANIARHVTMRDFFTVLSGYRLFRLCMNGALIPLDPYDVKRCEIYITQNLVAIPDTAGR